MGQILLHLFYAQYGKVNESLKAISSKLRHVDMEQMKTEVSKYYFFNSRLYIVLIIFTRVNE